MVIRMSLLAFSLSIVAYFATQYTSDKLTGRKPYANQVTTSFVVQSEIHSKTDQLETKNVVASNIFDVQSEIERITIPEADLLMSESLANLHLKDFSEYLSGSRASEHTTLAFYTDERWYTFYEQLGYLPEDIEQLIVFRAQYLADISQNGKEYYWSRWSDAPHRALADTLAYELIQYLGSGESIENSLNNCISKVASMNGISRSLVERIGKTYLLNSIGSIEIASAIIEDKTDAFEFDSKFIAYLVEQAGYTKSVSAIDNNLRDLIH